MKTPRPSHLDNLRAQRATLEPGSTMHQACIDQIAVAKVERDRRNIADAAERGENGKPAPADTSHLPAALAALRAATSLQWEMACDTAGVQGDETEESAAEREADMRDSARQALASWDRALGALGRGDLTAAAEHVEEARGLAKNAGDDAPERAALAAIRAFL